MDVVVSLTPVSGNTAILQSDLQVLYDKISDGLIQLLKDHPTNIQTLINDLEPITVAITQIVKEYSAQRNPPLDNKAKQALALQLIKYALQKLNKDGYISNDLYGNLSISIDFFGPTLINGSVEIMKKLSAIEEDITKNGCAGCCVRNGCILQ